VLSLVLAAPAVHTRPSDIDIRVLLGQMASVYRNLTTFSTTLEMKLSSGPKEIKITTRLTLKKPAFLSAEVKVGENVTHVVADGQTAFTDTSTDKTRYIKQSARMLDEAMTILARHRGAGTGLLFHLLVDQSADKQLIDGVSLKKLPDQKVGGDDCDVILLDDSSGVNTLKTQIAIGKQDHLLRQILSNEDGEGGMQISETYSNTDLHPIVTDATFTYMPEPGAVAAQAPNDPPQYDPRLKVGALPLPLTGKDLFGKAVTLDEYKGKVLLLDFWATWCIPCMAEMPNIIAAHGKYHAMGFEVLGVSLDSTNVPRLRKFLKDHKMPWRQICDGKGWSGDDALIYSVTEIPFALLIGRDGKIAAVNPSGSDLVPVIEAALVKQ
jgi:thiol-disulfide isomerase/thioredoxin